MVKRRAKATAGSRRAKATAGSRRAKSTGGTRRPSTRRAKGKLGARRRTVHRPKTKAKSSRGTVRRPHAKHPRRATVRHSPLRALDRDAPQGKPAIGLLLDGKPAAQYELALVVSLVL